MLEVWNLASTNHLREEHASTGPGIKTDFTSKTPPSAPHQMPPPPTSHRDPRNPRPPANASACWGSLARAGFKTTVQPILSLRLPVSPRALSLAALSPSLSGGSKGFSPAWVASSQSLRLAQKRSMPAVESTGTVNVSVFYRTVRFVWHVENWTCSYFITATTVQGAVDVGSKFARFCWH
jgi:hypothetical protein